MSNSLGLVYMESCVYIINSKCVQSFQIQFSSIGGSFLLKLSHVFLKYLVEFSKFYFSKLLKIDSLLMNIV